MSKESKGLKMYFDFNVTKAFAKREQTEKHFAIARIIDNILINESKNLTPPFYIAELGGGAHPDRYHNFFKILLKEPKSHIDWVDISPYMLKLAREYLKPKEYQQREQIINFIEKDILKYLSEISNEKIDFAILKYTLDHLEDINKLFELLSLKLKKNGMIIATITNLGPELKSVSVNARYFYKGKEFPENETKTLKDGDNFTIKFFKEAGDSKKGFMKEAETIKYYHSEKKMRELAEKYGFKVFIGNWKDYLSKNKHAGETLDQDLLILKKSHKLNLT